MTSVYHPQADGQTERMNRVLEEMLRSYVGRLHTDWDRYLAQVEFAYNDAVHAGTGYSPFYLNYGEHPRTLLSVAVNNGQVTAAANVFRNIQQAVQLAKQHIVRAQAVYSAYASKGAEHSTYVVGDWVLLRAKNLNLPEHPNDKFKPRYIGPFKVARQIKQDTYALHLPDHMRVHNVFHASQLLPFRQRGEWVFPALERPGPVLVDGVEEHLVDKVLNRRNRRYGKGSRLEYLVTFVGAPDDTRWLPAVALVHAQDKVAEYEDTL